MAAVTSCSDFEAPQNKPRQHIKKQRHYFANKGPSSQRYGFPVVMYRCESSTIKKTECWRIDAFELWYWRRLLRLQDQTSPSERKSDPNIYWKDWWWRWNSNTLATRCKELTHLKRSWCWGRLKSGGEGDNRGWDGWMASPTQRTWVWASFGSWWWTGKPGVLQSMGSQRVRHDWTTKLNWTDYSSVFMYYIFFINSSVNGHLGCFHALSVINSASMNTGVHDHLLTTTKKLFFSKTSKI